MVKAEDKSNASSSVLFFQSITNSEVSSGAPLGSTEEIYKFENRDVTAPKNPKTVHKSFTISNLTLEIHNKSKSSSISFKPQKVKSSLSRSLRKPRISNVRCSDPSKWFVERLMCKRMQVFNAQYVTTLRHYLNKLNSSLNCDTSGCLAAQRRLYRHYQECHPESIQNLQNMQSRTQPPKKECGALKDRLLFHRAIHHPGEVPTESAYDGRTIKVLVSPQGQDINNSQASPSLARILFGRRNNTSSGCTVPSPRLVPGTSKGIAQPEDPFPSDYEKAIRYWLTKVPFNPQDTYATKKSRENLVQVLIDTIEIVSKDGDDVFYEDKINDAINTFLDAANIPYTDQTDQLREYLWDKIQIINKRGSCNCRRQSNQSQRANQQSAQSRRASQQSTQSRRASQQSHQSRRSSQQSRQKQSLIDQIQNEPEQISDSDIPFTEPENKKSCSCKSKRQNQQSQRQSQEQSVDQIQTESGEISEVDETEVETEKKCSCKSKRKSKQQQSLEEIQTESAEILELPESNLQNVPELLEPDIQNVNPQSQIYSERQSQQQESFIEEIQIVPEKVSEFPESDFPRDNRQSYQPEAPVEINVQKESFFDEFHTKSENVEELIEGPNGRRKSILRQNEPELVSDDRRMSRRQSIRIKSTHEIKHIPESVQSLPPNDNNNPKNEMDDRRASRRQSILQEIQNRRESRSQDRKESIKLALVESPSTSFYNYRNSQKQSHLYEPEDDESFNLRNYYLYDSDENLLHCQNPRRRNYNEVRKMESTHIEENSRDYLETKNRTSRQNCRELVTNDSLEPINMKYIPTKNRTFPREGNLQLRNHKRRGPFKNQGVNMELSFGSYDNIARYNHRTGHRQSVDTYSLYDSDVSITADRNYDELELNGKNSRSANMTSYNSNTEMYDRYVRETNKNDRKYDKRGQNIIKEKKYEHYRVVRPSNTSCLENADNKKVGKIVRQKAKVFAGIQQNDSDEEYLQGNFMRNKRISNRPRSDGRFNRNDSNRQLNLIRAPEEDCFFDENSLDGRNRIISLHRENIRNRRFLEDQFLDYEHLRREKNNTPDIKIRRSATNSQNHQNTYNPPPVRNNNINISPYEEYLMNKNNNTRRKSNLKQTLYEVFQPNININHSSRLSITPSPDEPAVHSRTFSNSFVKEEEYKESQIRRKSSSSTFRLDKEYVDIDNNRDINETGDEYDTASYHEVEDELHGDIDIDPLDNFDSEFSVDDTKMSQEDFDPGEEVDVSTEEEQVLSYQQAASLVEDYTANEKNIAVDDNNEPSNYNYGNFDRSCSIKTIQKETTAPSTISTWGKVSAVKTYKLDSENEGGCVTNKSKPRKRKMSYQNYPTLRHIVKSKPLCVCSNKLKPPQRKLVCSDLTRPNIKEEILSWLNRSHIIRDNGAWNRKEVVEDLLNHLQLPSKEISKPKLKSKIIRLLQESDICTADCARMRTEMNAFAEDLVNRLLGIQQRLESSGTRNWKCSLRRHKMLDNMEYIMIGPTEVLKSDLKHDLLIDVRDCLYYTKIGNHRDLSERITEVLLEKIELIRTDDIETVAIEVSNILNTGVLSEFEIEDVTECIIVSAKEIINFICAPNTTNATNIPNCAFRNKTVSVFMSESETNPSFSGTPTSNRNKNSSPRVSADEKSYTASIATVVKNWLLNAPDNFNFVQDENYIRLMTNELASEITDYMKLKQLTPETDKTDTDKFITYHAYKWMLKFKIISDIQNAEPYTRILVDNIDKINTPDLTRSQFGAFHMMNNTEYQNNSHVPQEDQDLLEEEITMWLNEQSSEMYLDESKNIQNVLVHELAEKLKPKLVSKQPDDELSKIIRHWMKKVVNSRKRTRIDSLSLNLMERIKTVPLQEIIEGAKQPDSIKPIAIDTIETSSNLPQSKISTAEDLNDSMKKILMKYIEYFFLTDDLLTKRGYIMVLKSELQKLGPQLRKEALETNRLNEKFSPESLNNELMYVKDISDWLKELPVDPIYNTTGNKDRLEFIMNLAKNIAEVEKDRRDMPFSMDYNGHLISTVTKHMQLLPLGTIPDQAYTALVNQLVVRVASRRNEVRRPLPERVQDVPQFIEEFIRTNGQEVAGDTLRLEAWTSRFIKEAKKLIAETEDKNAQAKDNNIVPDDSVKMFNLKLEYVNQVNCWIKGLPLSGTINFDMPYNLALEMSKFATGAISIAELVQYIQSWISQLPLDYSQDIDMELVINQLLNRMQKVNEKMKPEDIDRAHGASNSVPQTDPAIVSNIPISTAKNTSQKKISVDHPTSISNNQGNLQNEDASTKLLTNQAHSSDATKKHSQGTRISKDSPEIQTPTALRISRDEGYQKSSRPSTSSTGRGGQRKSDLTSSANSGDTITGIVEQWCNTVPLPSSIPQEQQYVIRDSLATKILTKISEMNSDHNTFRQNKVYTHLLDQELDKLLSALPQSEALIKYKNALKNDLLKGVNSVKSLINEESNQHYYRKDLENVVDRYIPPPSNLTPEQKVLLETIKEDIINNYINYIMEPRDRRQVFKNNMAESLVKYQMQIIMLEDEFASRNRVPIQLDKMIHEMSQFPPPNLNSLLDELSYMRMKELVKDFLNCMPVKERKEILEKALTKELHDMTKMDSSDYNTGNMKVVIEKYLQRHGVPTNDRTIYDVTKTDELINNVRELARQRDLAVRKGQDRNNLQQTPPISESRPYDIGHSQGINPISVGPTPHMQHQFCPKGQQIQTQAVTSSSNANDSWDQPEYSQIGTTDTDYIPGLLARVRCQRCYMKNMMQNANQGIQIEPPTSENADQNQLRNLGNNFENQPGQDAPILLGHYADNFPATQRLPESNLNQPIQNPNTQMFMGGPSSAAVPTMIRGVINVTMHDPAMCSQQPRINQGMGTSAGGPVNHPNAGSDSLYRFCCAGNDFQSHPRAGECGPSHLSTDGNSSAERDCYCELYPVLQSPNPKRKSYDSSEDLGC